MKKVLLILFLSIFVTAAFAQIEPSAASTSTPDKDSLLPYQEFPTLPAFNILELDSVTKFNTYTIPEGHPTILMLFSPDCEHCQHMTQMITQHMDSLKDINFYMVTPLRSMSAIKDFYDKYNLKHYKNIKVVGRDYEYFFFNFYGAHYVPYLAIYDKHKKFIKKYEGGATVRELYEATH